MDPWLPFFHLFPIIGAGATWFGWKQYRRYRIMLRTWARVDGVIVNRERHDGEDTTWAAVYEYEFASRRLTGTSSVSVGDKDYFRTGGRLTILVDPLDPTQSDVLNRHLFWAQVFPLILGLCFLLGGGFFSFALIAGWVK